MLGILLLGVALAAPTITVALPEGETVAWAGALSLHDAQTAPAKTAQVRLVDVGGRWRVVVRTRSGEIVRLVEAPRTDAQREDVLALARALFRQESAPRLSLPTLSRPVAQPPVVRRPVPVPVSPKPPELPAIHGIEQPGVALSPRATGLARTLSAHSYQPLPRRRAPLSVELSGAWATGYRGGTSAASGVEVLGRVVVGAVAMHGGASLFAPSAIGNQPDGARVRERDGRIGATVQPSPLPLHVGVEVAASHRAFSLDNATVASHWQGSAGPVASMRPRLWRGLHLQGNVAARRDLARTIMHVDEVASGSLRPWKYSVSVGLMQSRFTPTKKTRVAK